MHVRFVYPAFERPSVSNPELADTVGADRYVGTPSMAIAILASLTPPPHTLDFRDDRVEDLGLDDDVDLVAIPVFTPAAERAMEIADLFRARGVPVVAGGVFTTLMPDEMAPHVDAVVIGEGEPVWAQVLADAEAGHLRPRYQHPTYWSLDEATVVPRYDLYLEKFTTLDHDGHPEHLDLPCQLSRGCPIVCDDCVIPPYMGRSVRLFPPSWIRSCFEALAQDDTPRGVCLTEDVSIMPMPSVIRHLQAVTEAVEDLGTRVSYIGVSPHFTLRARPEFFDALRRLRTFQLYLVFGFDPLSHRAFGAQRDDAAFGDAVDAVRRAHDEGLYVYCSLPMGQDFEDQSVFDRILEFTERAGIRSAEFPIITPYPGTRMWHRLVEQDRILHRRWTKYNDANVVFRPAAYTPERLLQGYLDVWREFYKDERRTAMPIQV